MVQLCGRALLSTHRAWVCFPAPEGWETHMHTRNMNTWGVLQSNCEHRFELHVLLCVRKYCFLSGFVSFCFVCALFCLLKMESHLCLSRDRRWLNLSVGCAELTSDLTSTPSPGRSNQVLAVCWALPHTGSLGSPLQKA